MFATAGPLLGLPQGAALPSLPRAPQTDCEEHGIRIAFIIKLLLLMNDLLMKSSWFSTQHISVSYCRAVNFKNCQLYVFLLFLNEKFFFCLCIDWLIV